MTKFLNKQAYTFWSKALNVMITFILMIVVSLIVTNFLYPTLYAQAQFWVTWKHPFLVTIVETIILAPLIEEVMYRHFPLTFARVLSRKLIIPTMFFTSIIFGLMHYGYPSLFLQGVLGFLLCILYMKNGYSYWSTVTAHALYNLTVVLIL